MLFHLVPIPFHDFGRTLNYCNTSILVMNKLVSVKTPIVEKQLEISCSKYLLNGNNVKINLCYTVYQ
jgi:hypothetical protein